MALEKFPSEQLSKILYQHGNARPYVSAMSKEYLKKKNITPIVCPTNSPDLNIIENIWSIVDNKLLKFSINTIDELKNALQIVWSDISNDTIRKIFESLCNDRTRFERSQKRVHKGVHVSHSIIYL